MTFHCFLDLTTRRFCYLNSITILLFLDFLSKFFSCPIFSNATLKRRKKVNTLHRYDDGWRACAVQLSQICKLIHKKAIRAVQQHQHTHRVYVQIKKSVVERVVFWKNPSATDAASLSVGSAHARL